MELDVVYNDPATQGWSPIGHMARLASELLDGELITTHNDVPFLAKLHGTVLPRMRRGSRACLMIAPFPSAMNTLFRVPGWRTRYDKVVAWVFDSFWVNHVPQSASFRQHFDHVFVTEPEDIDQWRAQLRNDVSWLPWGTDALRFGSSNRERTTDVLRFGRQPPGWDDDDGMREAFAAIDLVYAQRPSGSADPTKNEQSIVREARNAKFTLSFSNRVNPAEQTHPSREYITSRWAIALACGATVAGVPPRTRVVDELLWPEALLSLPDIDVGRGIDSIARAVSNWNPDHAELNHRRALERLDWRWRFQEIANFLGRHAPKLDAEIAQIRQLVGA